MMITAPVTENALLGAGATASHTVTASPFLISAPLTREQTEGVPTAAGTPWSAMVKELARPGAGATVFQIAELISA